MAQEKASPKPEKIPPGFELLDTLQVCEEHMLEIAWSPDGRMLASGSADKTIRLWYFSAALEASAHSGELCRTLKGHNAAVISVAWSPDGQRLASGSSDHTICLWNGQSGKLLQTLRGHNSMVWSVAWSPNGRMLASGSNDHTVCLWNGQSGKLLQVLQGHSNTVFSVSWSLDGRALASGSLDNTIRLWDGQSGKLLQTLQGHDSPVTSVAWLPSGRMFVSGSLDNTIRLWDAESGQETRTLKWHTGSIHTVYLSSDGILLASNSSDGTVRFWRCDTWEPVASLGGHSIAGWAGGLALHPTAPIMASRGEDDRTIHIWRLDYDVLLGAAPVTPSVHYTNAKVVLMGETSTGKTCLARALMTKPFEPQESTHGMEVWNFHTETAKRPGGGQITRETLLWDLAGQTDYQVVHQLFLDETSLGIVLFDPTHPENPFGGVGHWEKALQRVVGEGCPRLLVAGRVDRGHPTATARDIETFRRKHGFREFIATSAKTGQGVEELRAAIARAIPWDNLPVTSSPELWKDIREYLLERRAGEDVLTRRSDLREAFRQGRPEAEFTEAEFDTVIRHAQAQGLVWQLSFGDFVLLKPELLNDYASAVVRVARKHDKGLGCAEERDVLEARIDFEDMERLTDAETERSLLYAVVELLLDREVALREGEHLVLPSKFNRKRPEYPKPPIREVAYHFAGPIEDIYATLVVRLFYSRVFELKDLWKNAAEFCCPVGRICGFLLSSPEEGQGVISVFFEETVSMDSKVLFLRFIHEHLQRRAIADSVTRERIYRCPRCGEEVENKRAVAIRLKKGKKTIPCQYCDERIRLIDLLEEKFGDPELLRQVREMEEEVEERREQAVGVITAKAKEDIGEFDVFLAHNSRDKQQVIVLAEALKGRGLNPWLDIEQIPPGRWFQDVIQEAIPQVKSAAVIIGAKGLGRWQTLELRSFISQCVERKIPVIPVLLPGITKLPPELLFLQELSWVRFSVNIDETEALDNLEWGITGERPQRRLR